MRVLVTGGTGLLGSYFIRGRADNVIIACVQRAPATSPLKDGLKVFEADITAADSLRAVLKGWPAEVVFHTAGEGSVDRVQNDRDMGLRSILGGTQLVTDTCKQLQIPLVYLSSNAVFSGDAAPYRETSLREPVNEYGRLKLLAEDLVLQASDKNLVCRPILSFGWPLMGQRQNPVSWLVGELRQNRPVKVVNDVWENPIGADSVARAVWQLIANEQSGIFNVGGAERLSRFEFARLSAEVFHLDPTLIEPVESSAFPSLARRPRDTTLDTSKLQQMTKWRPRSVRDDLTAMKSHEPT
jgi:dTDP-4-dehydrorhamnose reductase